MSAKKKYIELEKDGKNIFSIYNELKVTHSSIRSMAMIREIFPDLSLEEVKEVMILAETDYSNIEEYQKDIFKKIQKKF